MKFDIIKKDGEKIKETLKVNDLSAIWRINKENGFSDKDENIRLYLDSYIRSYFTIFVGISAILNTRENLLTIITKTQTDSITYSELIDVFERGIDEPTLDMWPD